MARTRLTSGNLSPYAVPPLWFVGLHETLGGYVVDALPRGNLPAWIAREENAATDMYRSHRGLFRPLATMAAATLLGVLAVGLCAYVWNSRRLPAPLPARHWERRAWSAWVAAALKRFVVRDGAAQAGFFFTLQTLSRSVPHRVVVVTAMSVGLAAATAALQAGDSARGTDVARVAPVFLGIQSMFVGVLLVAFRHCVSVPAELRASWIFRVAWCGHERRFLAGAKRAVLMAVLYPTLLALLPLHVLVIGWLPAVIHLVFGFLLAGLLLEALLLGFRSLPFVSKYVPSDNLKTAAGVYLVAFLAFIYGIAVVERWALPSQTGSTVLLGIAGLCFIAVRIPARWQPRADPTVEDEELPNGFTQRLGLNG